ncbi:phosphocholine cytidylyltransferase family protein [Bradyrhizobium sp. CCBAU 53421]|uniref:phosphocholine cytidylyltransferase family protein n=1 Tax=Bradyrhizobium sp. CCBAU 53421 TaxID=1325120 RepID=UPI00188D45CA|nr:phosphocholine cytidylyltransferase family protein [Bradyrhizobium sp. CCBAU 53421]QOZ36352.1 phosphocholine cytidylyltransferase family protein [Bradyrhizobium sp. CCBAU 53421]
MANNAPKKAVILAAGMGSRLRPLTDLRPKPLVEVNGVPILHNALRNLREVGVVEATIVVGYRKDAIQYACDRRYANMDINYIENAAFERTGSAYSLWLARDCLLSTDCYLLEGDVFFEKDVLGQLMIEQATDAAAVAPFTAMMEGSAVVLSDSGLISAIHVKQTSASLASAAAPLFKTINVLRFAASTLRSTIVPALDEIIGSGATRSYTEELLAFLIERRGLQLAAVRCDDLKWYEIDTAGDLEIAERIFASRSTFRPPKAPQNS